MATDLTHYEALDIAEDASSKEVKAAFYKKVRQHPPEQDPDTYKVIREAYDVLSNPVSRKEYDSMSSYGEEINQLEQEATTLLQEDPPSVDTAIKKLKRAVILGPEIGLLRNLLGQAFLMDDAPENALSQFEKALDIDGSNPAYKLNKAEAQKQLGNLRSAESTLRFVWNQDQGDYAAARALAQVLFEQDEIDEAHEVLDTAIWDDGKLDFEDFFCYFDKLQLYLLQGQTDTLEAELERIKSLPETQDDREFAAFMLGRSGWQLYELNAFSLAHRYIETATELDPSNERLRVLQEHVEDLRGLEEDLEAVIESDEVHDLVKHMLSVMYQKSIDGAIDVDLDARLEEGVDALNNVMNVDPEHTKIKSSLRLIRRKYQSAYELNPDLFDAVLQHPSPRLFSGECPHCGSTITADNEVGTEGSCPDCSGHVRFIGSEFVARNSWRSSGRTSRRSSTGSQTRDRDSRDNSGNDASVFKWIGIIALLLFLMSMCN
jgi:tetratricopeptide (TPR) repeat protein